MSSSNTAVPLTPVFKTGLVSVLLVNVVDELAVTSISLVSAKVPADAGNVTVISAVKVSSSAEDIKPSSP